LSRIDFGEYIRDLTRELVQTYGVAGVAVRVEAGDVRLGIDEAVPCGLIIHELVSNALKHAFPQGRAGEVAVRLERTSAGFLNLEVKDDGVGFPKGFDFRKSSSLGLQVVCGLLRQLGGEIDRLEGRGTTFKISFQVSEPARLSVPE
jgi:two-component sensor histidine kinase